MACSWTKTSNVERLIWYLTVLPFLVLLFCGHMYANFLLEVSASIGSSKHVNSNYIVSSASGDRVNSLHTKATVSK